MHPAGAAEALEIVLHSDSIRLRVQSTNPAPSQETIAVLSQRSNLETGRAAIAVEDRVATLTAGMLMIVVSQLLLEMESA